MYFAFVFFGLYSVFVTVLLLLVMANGTQGLYVRGKTAFLDRKYRKMLDEVYLQEAIKKEHDGQE